MLEVQFRSCIESVFGFSRFRTICRSHFRGSMNLGIICPTETLVAKYPVTRKVVGLYVNLYPYKMCLKPFTCLGIQQHGRLRIDITFFQILQIKNSTCWNFFHDM